MPKKRAAKKITDPRIDIMEKVRVVINKLYKADRQANKMNDYRVEIKLRPNPLNYDGVDECRVELHEYKDTIELSPTPHYKTLFDNVLFTSQYHFNIADALEELSKHYA